MLNTTEKGNQFENYAQRLYEGLGYSVQKNLLINGKQVDLLAKKYVSGIGEIKLIIECKYLSKGNVSNETIYKFSYYISSIINVVDFTKAVLLTNNGFTKDANAIEKKNIQLRTITQLENELFKLSPAYLNYVNKYKEDEIYKEYIPLHGIQGIRPLENIEDYLLNKLIFINNKKSRFITVLADYGSGKTTLLKKIYFEAANKNLKGLSTLKPFYLELKKYNESRSLEVFLTSSFKQEFGIDIPFNLLISEIDNGQFILLLDGFDEMTSHINRETRIENFILLSRLFNNLSLTILTCRPSYFITNNEYEYLMDLIKERKKGINIEGDVKISSSKLKKKIDKRYLELFNKYSESSTVVPNFNKEITTFHLSPFSVEQINLFLEKFNSEFIKACSKNWQEVKEKLNSIYDLSDLMTKPILLSIIKDTILLDPKGFFNNSKSSGPAILYEQYTSLKLDIDWSKGKTRHFLLKDTRRELSEILAIGMFDTGKLKINYDELIKIIESVKFKFAGIKELNILEDKEEIISDIIICSFITLTQDDEFKFIHKSFMEFFLARYIKKGIKLNDIDNRFRQIKMPKEVLFFIGSFAMVEPKLKQNIIRHYQMTNEKILRRNIAATYIYSFEKHENRSFINLNLDEIDLRKIKFYKSTFQDVIFSKLKFQNVIFEECTFNTTEFLDCSFVETTFKVITATLTLSSCNVEFSCFESLKDYREIKLICHNTNFHKIEFKVCKITFEGLFSLNNIDVADSEFAFEHLKSEMIISNSKFYNSTIKTEPIANRVNFRATTFSNCILIGLVLDFNDFQNLKFQNCSGLIFTNSKKLMETEKFSNGKYIHEKSKNLMIIDLELRNNENLKDLLINHFSKITEEVIDNYLNQI